MNMDNPLDAFKDAIITEEEGKRTLRMGSQQQLNDVPIMPTRPRWLDRWEPRSVDVQFFVTLFAGMKDGGEWEIPRTGSRYRIDKTDKKLILVKGKIDEWFWKNAKTMPKLGYAVIVDKTISDGSGKTAIQQRENQNPPAP